MTNRAIAALSTLFVVLFALLVARAAWVMVIQGPQIASKPYNPRHALLGERRGRILATDGTVLAQTVNGKRHYPAGASLAQPVGYVSARYGTSGLEDAYDRALTPPDTTGDAWAQLAEITGAFGGKNELPRGADIVTTIVPSIQSELFEQLNQYRRAGAVVLDPRTGAVLALGSVPSYDPNDFDAEFASLNTDPQTPLIDRALDGLYPPGSTFKVFVAAAALDAGTVQMSDRFEDPGYLTVGDFTLHDNEGEATGDRDLTGAFALSSNVDFAQIALKMGTDEFYSALDKWDIGQSLDFQLHAERSQPPDKATLVPGELAQLGFGQASLLVSPLQMALITATIANNGTMPRPYIVRQVVRNGTPASVTPSGSLATPISADTAANVKKMMIAVVQYGTGTGVRLPNVQVAGKTGTATNPHGASHSWFVAFAPADNPRVAVAVVVENVGYGASFAGPIARNVLRVALDAIKE